MKQFIPLYLRPKPFASAVAVAVASTFLLSAHAAGDAAASRTNSANNFEAETRALDEQKAALVNTPASPAIVVNAPRIDARLIALMSPEQKKSMGVKNNSTSPQGFKQGGGTISGVTDDVIQSDGMVRIDLIARGDGKALQAELAAMGMKNMSAIGRSISGDLPIASMAKMSASANLISARPSVQPVRNSGSVQSQGDSAQKSDVARNVSGANGAGVKVGILSDSYNFLKGEASGVASGDLPGDGNTNGFTMPVKVLKDFGSDSRPGSDEGRAMAEIIHDVSPGAALSFYTAFESAQDFAIGIVALADDGAKVIVDDISYFSEPWFQDGVIAQAVKTVTQRGVTYLSAAGNFANISYESAYTPVTGVTALKNLDGTELGDFELHSFNTNGQLSTSQRVALSAGRRGIIYLQWDEPFASASAAISGPGAGSDLDVFYLAREGDFSSVITQSTFNNLGGDAFEALGVDFTGAAGTTADIYVAIGRPVKRLVGDPVDPNAGNPRFLKTIYRGFSGVDASLNGRSTIIGQSNAADTISVCAVNYTKVNTPTGPQVENFSALGGTTILFSPEGRRTFEPRRKPDLCAPDGANTTFFSAGNDPDGDGKPNFLGTSAAAPHAAGVAALMLQASKNRLSPFFITNLLRTTTTDMDDPNTPRFDRGFDFRTGFGFINADIAVGRASKFGF